MTLVTQNRIKMLRRILNRRKVLQRGVIVSVILLYAILFLFVHFRKNVNMLDNLQEIRSLVSKHVPPTYTEKELKNKLDHLSVFEGMPVEYTYREVNNRTIVWKLKYDNFELPPPLFYSDKSKQLFFKSADNAKFVGSRSKEALKGEIHLVRNGSYSTHLDCGYRSNVSQVLQDRSVSRKYWFHKLVPIYTPESWSFQHFIDSALPKVVQVLHILKDPNVILLFNKSPRDKINFEILEAFNISRGQIQFLSTEVVGADYLYFTCIAPPIHPVLWQSARRLIGASETLKVKSLKEAFVVLITRKGCHNCGRVVRNKNDVISMLEKRYGNDSVKVFNGGVNLEDVKHLFGKSRVILGSHGGGMYNINFAPINTTVIEFMPTRSDGTMEAASKDIIWSQASLLGQIYWRMCLTPISGSRSDMIVDLDELSGILDITDKRIHETKATP